jgi:hypothetical protein
MTDNAFFRWARLLHPHASRQRGQTNGALWLADKRREEALERIADRTRQVTYDGDTARCLACVVGWDNDADRSHVTKPCPRYPDCSQPIPSQFASLVSRHG